MSVKRSIMLAIAGLLLGNAPLAAEPHQLKKFAPSVVNIFTLEVSGGYIRAGEGSGSIISNQGYIATNNHVIEIEEDGGGTHVASEVRVFFAGETVPLMPCDKCSRRDQMFDEFQEAFKKGLKAEVQFHDANRDLAVLKTQTPIANPAVTITTAEPDQGDPIFAVGFPDVAQQTFASSAVEPTLTSGAVGRVYSTDNGGSQIRIIQHNAGINHGNSGGPLIDACERVVGVNTWSPAAESQAIFYASSITELVALLKQYGIPANIVDTPCDPNDGAFLGLPDKYMPIVYGGVAIAGLGLVMLVWLLRRAATNRPVDAMPVQSRPSNASHLANGAPGHVRLLGQGAAAQFSGKVEIKALARAPQGLVIGRHETSAGFVVAHEEVSRRHALLTMRGDEIILEDLGSTNGTRINGHSLAPGVKQPLRNGDRIRLGSLEFEVKHA